MQFFPYTRLQQVSPFGRFECNDKDRTIARLAGTGSLSDFTISLIRSYAVASCIIEGDKQVDFTTRRRGLPISEEAGCIQQLGVELQSGGRFMYRGNNLSRGVLPASYVTDGALYAAFEESNPVYLVDAFRGYVDFLSERANVFNAKIAANASK